MAPCSRAFRLHTIVGVNGMSVEADEPPGDRRRAPRISAACYSWRKVMPPLAAAGYHVIAPDQRGYGCTIVPADGAA